MAIVSQNKATRTLGKYALFERLGEGHLGPVYEGLDRDTGQKVAIRVLCDDVKWDKEIECIFDFECRSAARLQHPNIARIFDVGKEAQTRYIVMESLDGLNLERVIAQKPAMPVEAKIAIMIQTAEGLGCAHKNGVLHRDLSPRKIHVAAGGRVKIRDFAIAHVLKKHLPRPNVRWGAPIYLSPEQIQNKDCDERSDIFSAGMLFYELLTYIHPFHDADSNKALDNILQDAEIPTFDRFPEAPPGIWGILNACMARDPRDRYQNMEELTQAFRDLLRDMAEDARLMLAELQASLAVLKRAAAQPDAPESTVMLFRDIEKHLRGSEDADYITLDRLMTALSEQYPAIQKHASDLRPLESKSFQLPLETESIGLKDERATVDREAGTDDKPGSDQPEADASPPSVSIPLQKDACTPTIQGVGKVRSDSGTGRFQKVMEETQADKPAPIPVKPAFVPRAAKALAVWSSEGSAPMPVRPKKYFPSAQRCREIAKTTYRSAAGLLSILLIVVSMHIFLNTGAVAPLYSALKARISDWMMGTISSEQPGPGNLKNASAAAESGTIPEQKRASTQATVLKVTGALAEAGRSAESAGLMRRILDVYPAYESARSAIKEMRESSLDPSLLIDTKQPPPSRLARISALIDSRNFQRAKAELNKLQQSYPGSGEILALWKRWQAASAGETQELDRRMEEERHAARQKKEAEWHRQAMEFFARGDYGEAGAILSLWMAEFPDSASSAEFRAKMEEVRRGIKAYTSAIAEKRYQDALDALNSVERINPTDPNLTELREHIEAEKAAAKAALTVYRLGPKAILLLDGRPVGNDGEIVNEKIPIGKHTLAIANDAGIIASRNLDFFEGQGVFFVYDSAKQILRPMNEADRGLLSQRKIMEAVHRFAVEHHHNLFRGACRGDLLLSYYEVVYKPSSGSHGFRIPFNILDAKVTGRLIEFLYVSDHETFQNFRLPDEETALKFKQNWDELKSVGR